MNLLCVWKQRSAVELFICVWKQLVECCFTSTETVGLLGTGALDVHLDFHTALELCFETSFC